jgi:hypothetical protein
MQQCKKGTGQLVAQMTYLNYSLSDESKVQRIIAVNINAPIIIIMGSFKVGNTIRHFAAS